MHGSIFKTFALAALVATVLCQKSQNSRRGRRRSTSFPHTATPTRTATEHGLTDISIKPRTSEWNSTFTCNVTCGYGKIAYLKKGNGWRCYCVENSFHDCLAQYRMDGKDECKPIFITITAIQCAILVVAVSLNGIIIWKFYKRAKNRTKIPNILLFNQALVDVASCLIYSIPNIIHVIYQLVHEEIIEGYTAVSVAFLTLTASTSIFLYIVITVDRFLSIYLPLWHLANIHPRHLWRATALQWLLSIIFTAISLALMFSMSVKARWQFLRSYRDVFVVVLIVLVALISLTMIACFCKALYSLHLHHQQRDEDVQDKKRFQLMSVFLVMYVVFLATFIPIAVSAFIGSRLYNAQNQTIITIFTFSSVLNASLTMYYRREFRPSKYSTQVRAPRSINLSSTYSKT